MEHQSDESRVIIYDQYMFVIQDLTQNIKNQFENPKYLHLTATEC
jgi:hypothetical protein